MMVSKKIKPKFMIMFFVGSNSSLVAPVTLEEDQVLVGAGSVVTKNVKKKFFGFNKIKTNWK